MFWKPQTVRLEELLVKAEVRAERAEAALAVERRERMADIRHVISMFLRREKTYPLPPTETEKAEAKAETERETAKAPSLTDVQLAQREALRKHRPEGVTQEEADEVFSQLVNAGQME